MAKQIEREVGNLMVFDEVRPAVSATRMSPCSALPQHQMDWDRAGADLAFVHTHTQRQAFPTVNAGTDGCCCAQVVQTALDGDIKRVIKPTLVSVTKVELTRDLGVAKISVAITGRESGQEQAMNTLLGLRGCVLCPVSAPNFPGA